MAGMSLPASPPAGWKIRQIPWLEPGSAVSFSGQDLTLDQEITTSMVVGANLGRGGQAAVFSVSLPEQLPGSWVRDDVVLRVSYQDDEYGRDPRRTSIYRELAGIRDVYPSADPLEGLLRLHAVGHLPPSDFMPGQELWAQVLDRGGMSLQQWVSGTHGNVLGPQDGVAVMLPIMASLAVCHQQGIVHRDIKPGNVFVTDRCPIPAPPGLDGPRAARLFAASLPFLRLGDLGSMTNLSAAAMARLEAGAAPEALIGEDLAEEDSSEAMTHTFTTNIDTGPFTPPEVWTSAAQSEANPAGDVWQLAVTLFFACTGELPFQGWRGHEWRTERARYVQATQGGEPNSDRFEDLPERLQYLLRWCLTPDPMDRPDLTSLTEELQALTVEALTAEAAASPAPHREAGRPGVRPPFDDVSDLEETGTTDETGLGARTPAEVAPHAPTAPRPMTDSADSDPDTPRDQPAEPSAGLVKAPVAEPEWSTPSTAGAPRPARSALRPAGARPATVKDEAGTAPGDRVAAARRAVTAAWNGPRRAWIATAAALCVGLLVLGMVLANTRENPPTDQAGAGIAQAAAVPASPRLTSAVDWKDGGSNLSQILPQLFTSTPMAKRPTLGMLQESEYQFCDPCVGTGLRLRVVVTPAYTGTLTANAQPVAEPIGPYLVLATPRSQDFPVNPLAMDRNRVFPLAARYASPKYQQVVLIPANRIGEGRGPSANDRSWQTQVSQSRKSQQLTFDIPGQVAFITVLWFNQQGVVGFNRFDRSHQRPTIQNP